MADTAAIGLEKGGHHPDDPPHSTEGTLMAKGDSSLGTPFQRSLGLHWSSDDEHPNSVIVELDMRDDLRGPAGTLEGGVVSTLADVASASAGARVVGALVATEHLSISFLAPGRVGPIRAIGTTLRTGKHDAVAEVRITDTGHDDRLMAVGLVTLRILSKA